MDLSALIFVALAVAWAVYLVPKALRHHEEDALNRSVDGFSDRLRVLARREAVSAREAALVPAGRAGARADAAPVVDAAEEPEEAAAPTPAPRAPRPAITPTQRRRRVLTAILAVLVAVAALGLGGVIAKAWIIAPVVLLVAWLVACRLMVKKERAVAPARSAAPPVEAEDSGAAVLRFRSGALGVIEATVNGLLIVCASPIGNAMS